MHRSAATRGIPAQRDSSASASLQPRRLYGLGLSFAEQFRSYPATAPWPSKQDHGMSTNLSIAAVRDLTAVLCPLTDDEIAAYAPMPSRSRNATPAIPDGPAITWRIERRC